jgi:hypothetical protein
MLRKPRHDPSRLGADCSTRATQPITRIPSWHAGSRDTAMMHLNERTECMLASSTRFYYLKECNLNFSSLRKFLYQLSTLTNYWLVIRSVVPFQENHVKKKVETVTTRIILPNKENPHLFCKRAAAMGTIPNKASIDSTRHFRWRIRHM